MNLISNCTQFENESIVTLSINPNEKILGLKKLNSIIKEGEIICSIQDPLTNNKQPLFSPHSGKIKELTNISTNELKIVIEICLHETEFGGLCADCGSKIIQNKNDQSSQSHSNYLFTNSTLKFNEDKVKKLEIDYLSKLRENKKLILLLDIDNTILHASHLKLTEKEYNYLKQKFGWTFTCLSIRTELYFIKFRPFLKEFLEEIKDKYEIYIYTAATRDYAEEIIKYLNEKLKFNYFSKDRLAARENNETRFTSKTIKKVLPSDERIVLILDDRTDVWENSENLINLTPYYFFKEEFNPANYLLSKYLKEDDDFVLVSVTKMLVFLQKAFYLCNENGIMKKEELDIKLILKLKLKEIMKDVYASYIDDKHTNIFDTIEFFIMNKLGGVLDCEICRKTNFIITNETGIEKFSSFKDKFNVVNKIWLNFCYIFFCKIDFNEFHLKNLKRYYSQKEIFEKNKKNIDELYSEQEVDNFIELLKIKYKI